MDTRPGLIERAAALLREDVNPMGPPSLDGPAISSSGIGSGSAGRITRTHTLDRVALAGQGIVMPWADTQRAVEEFRVVKRNVLTGWQSLGHLNGSRQSAHSVMVTSSKPREGKTFTTLNLALSFAAEENLTVILVDADPIRGDAGRQLRVPSEPGLTTVLSGDVGLTDALIQTDLPNLLVLPCGAHGPH